MLTINALVASNSVILPMEAHYESYEALRHILDVIARIKANYNSTLAVEGILITKYQSRTRLCRQVSEYTEKNFGDKVHIFPNTIPFSIKAAELSSVGRSIFEHDPHSDVASLLLSNLYTHTRNMVQKSYG
jgi:chromosome partitioning protein